ncbi:MAG: Crp/Fnr family transcriptional regulator [Alistipes sp.]|jgi:CRP-like cAMP-binding protein|nr:Crp/Fnr family transcriptional regulator [Alistipes sp.]
MDEELKHLLAEQAGGIRISDELAERMMGAMTETRLKNKEVLIPLGKRDSNLYIQRNGLMRALYFDGDTEKTYGFANPGTVTLSYHSHFAGRPSVFQFESCGDTDVLKMSEKDMDNLMADSHEFTRWLLAIHEAQCYFNEYKHAALKGTAKERYLSLVEKRPDILARVSLKVVASYLGVAPNYLNFLKKQLRKEGK